MTKDSNIPHSNKASVIIGSLALIALMYPLFAKAIKEIALICWESPDYSHGILLPFISGYFLYQDRSEIINSLYQSLNVSKAIKILIYSVLCSLFVVSCLIAFLGQISELNFFSWFSFFLTLHLTIFLCLGVPFALKISLPLWLIFTAKPLPDILVPKLFFPLQVFSAKISYATLKLLNVPSYLKGNIIEIPHMSLMVEEACSGMRSVLAFLSIALITLMASKLNWVRSILVIFSALVLAIALNTARVAITGLLAHFVSAKAAEGFFHEFSGLITFSIGLIFLFFLTNLLERTSNKGKSNA